MKIEPTAIPDLRRFVFEKLISIEEIPMEPQDPLEQELLAFLHCVATGETPPCSGRDARRALELGTRILESIREKLRQHQSLALR